MEPDVPWDEIARAYRDLSIPFAEVCARFGVTTGELKLAAQQRDWPTRGDLRRGVAFPPLAAPRKGTKSAAKAAGRKRGPAHAVAEPPTGPSGSPPQRDAAKPAKGAQPQGLVKRIYNTIDKELSKLEEHAGKSSQDRERASRALSQMVSSLEKAVEMQREIARESGRKRGGKKDTEALKHAEELRREIADRLERLHRQRAAAK